MHILTAAHCVTRVRRSQIQHVHVRTGSLEWKNRGKVYPIQIIRVFPGYGRQDGFRHDVAIIKVSIQ